MSKSQRSLRYVVVVVFAFLVIAISATATSVQASTLAVGDIAFSGYIANGGAAQPDQFSFVLLTPITTGTVIKFTDFGWRNSTGNFTSGAGTESEITFTAGGNFPAGTEIWISGTNASLTGGVSGPAGTVVYSSGGLFISPMNLGNGGDQILAYTGTFAAPVFIAGIHMNSATGTDATNWDLDGGAAPPPDTATSSKPPALTTGTNALWIGAPGDAASKRQNARFTCGSAAINTAAAARAALNNQANWTANNTNPPGFKIPSGCGYLGLPTAAPATISGVVTTSEGSPLAGVSVNLSGGHGRRAITDGQGQYRFNNVEAGDFYTVTPSRANYNFGPVNRSFSLVGIQSEAVFTGTLTGDNVNPIDTAEYFVRQQYVDVLGREPDESGFNYWSDQILACGDDARCVNQRRRDVAAAFFIENEYQASGSYIYDVYAGALGRRPMFGEYSNDRQQVVGGATLDAAKTAFAQSFVLRREFATRYQANDTAESFVDALIQNVQASGVDLGNERTNLLSAYTAGSNVVASRAAVIRAIADNATFKQSQYNEAFVLTEYFAYLRRDADPDGYSFWLNVLNTGDPNNFRGMVCSFMTSTEYQRRFSNVVSHSNGECGHVTFRSGCE